MDRLDVVVDARTVKYVGWKLKLYVIEWLISSMMKAVDYWFFARLIYGRAQIRTVSTVENTESSKNNLRNRENPFAFHFGSQWLASPPAVREALYCKGWLLFLASLGKLPAVPLTAGLTGGLPAGDQHFCWGESTKDWRVQYCRICSWMCYMLHWMMLRATKYKSRSGFISDRAGGIVFHEDEINQRGEANRSAILTSQSVPGSGTDMGTPLWMVAQSGTNIRSK
jgi:hypothetical protein